MLFRANAVDVGAWMSNYIPKFYVEIIINPSLELNANLTNIYW